MPPLKRFLSAPAAHVLQIFTILHLGVKHEGDAQPPTLCCVAAQRTPPPPTHHSASYPLVSCCHSLSMWPYLTPPFPPSQRLLHPVGFLRHLSLKAAAAAAASLCVCVCCCCISRLASHILHSPHSLFSPFQHPNVPNALFFLPFWLPLLPLRPPGFRLLFPRCASYVTEEGSIQLLPVCLHAPTATPARLPCHVASMSCTYACPATMHSCTGSD